MVGAVSDDAEGWKLLKRCISVRRGHSFPFVSCDGELWIAAHLLQVAENEAARKLSIHDFSSKNPPLLVSAAWSVTWIARDRFFMMSQLWIFTPDLWFSSPTCAGPVRAVKVLWKPISDPTPNKSKPTSSIDETHLSSEVFTSLCNMLSRNQYVLPRSAHRYQEWNVSVLRRFSVDQVAQYNCNRGVPK